MKSKSLQNANYVIMSEELTYKQMLKTYSVSLDKEIFSGTFELLDDAIENGKSISKSNGSEFFYIGINDHPIKIILEQNANKICLSNIIVNGLNKAIIDELELNDESPIIISDEQKIILANIVSEFLTSNVSTTYLAISDIVKYVKISEGEEIYFIEEPKNDSL